MESIFLFESQKNKKKLKVFFTKMADTKSIVFISVDQKFVVDTNNTILFGGGV